MNKEETYTAATRRILELDEISLIYLLGEQVAAVITSGIFLDESYTARRLNHLYLLVVASADVLERKHQVEERIENACASIVTLTVMVVARRQWGNWLKDGNRFAYKVAMNAKLLFGISEIRPGPIELQDDTAKSEQIRMQGLNKVNEFLAGAHLFILRKQNSIAAFMLHQSIEQLMLTTIFIKTGLQVSSHNIGRLARYCTIIDSLTGLAYEQDNTAIQNLNRAYIDARYGESYRIKTHELTTLIDKVKVATRGLEC